MPEEKKPNPEELQNKIKELEKQKDEYLAGWQRERADFLNYKKEEMERIGGILEYAGAEFILKILPILDNFEVSARQNFASQNLSGQEKETVDKAVQGFLQIKIQLNDFLKSMGVEEVKCLGEKFDPNFQEVVEEVQDKNYQPGTVVEEIQKGYKIQDKVLRPAKVKISK